MTLKEVAATFEQGAHHPTILVLLQALLSLIGEVNISRVAVHLLSMYNVTSSVL